jgi:hypothetical protein
VNELQPTLVVTLGSSDARRLTDELKAEVEAVWEKLLILYEGEAWRALGYKSWGAYFEAEFGQSRRRGYQLLEAGRVLVPVKNCSLTPANEAQARELAPLLDELGEEALVQVWDGLVDEHGLEITAKLVRRAVQAKLKPEVSRAPAPPEVPPPVEVDQLAQAKRTLSAAYGKASSLIFDWLVDHPDADPEAVCQQVAPLGWQGLLMRKERNG